MDNIGTIIFLIIIVINIVRAIAGKKKKTPTQFPPRQPGDPASDIPQTFEELIKQAQEKAKRVQKQKEFLDNPSHTRQATPAPNRPGMEPLPERRILVDEDVYQPTVAPQPGAVERERTLERKTGPKPRVQRKPKQGQSDQVSNRPSGRPSHKSATQARPKTKPKQRPNLADRKPKAKITGTLSMENRIQAPENDFFADNEIGDITDVLSKKRKKGSAIRKKLKDSGEFEFNLKDAVIYSEIMRRKF